MDKLHYNIIASGSSGNCVTVEDVMIDCGVPFKKIKEQLYDIHYLLLTHTHSDHIKHTTYQNIRRLFPKILTIGNYEVHQAFGVDQISNEGFEIATKNYTFLPFRCPHDVLVHGYVWKKNDLDIIYATDTETLEYAPERRYDYFFIESNHDEKKLEQIRSSQKYGYNAYASGLRHLSTQKSKAFYYLYRKNDRAQWIELHKSRRFY